MLFEVERITYLSLGEKEAEVLLHDLSLITLHRDYFFGQTNGMNAVATLAIPYSTTDHSEVNAQVTNNHPLKN